MCFFGALNTMKAQTTVTIGSGTSSSQNVPIKTDYEYTLTQQIYLQSEIGTSAGTISSIAFKAKASFTRNIAVYMVNTDKSSFTSTNGDFVALPESSKVYDGSVTFVYEDWKTIELTTPFNYTGGNLLICVYNKTGSFSAPNQFYSYQSSSDNVTIGVMSYDELDSGFVNGGKISGTTSSFWDYSSQLIPRNIKNQIQLTITAGEGGGETPEPSAPENLQATAVTDSAVSLSWDASDNATSYNVYQYETLISNVSGTSAQITGLNPDTEYCFTVTALNEGGEESSPSDELCVSTLPSAGSDDGKVIGGDLYARDSIADPLPIYTTNEYAYSQQIYTSEELGIKEACEINEISFYKTNQYSATRNLEIYMLNTDKSSFSTNDWENIYDSYKVFDGEYTFTEQDSLDYENECKITLDTSFLYIPGKNILVCVVDKTATKEAKQLYFQVYATGVGVYQSITTYGATKRKLSRLNGFSGINPVDIYGRGYKNKIKLYYQTASTGVLAIPSAIELAFALRNPDNGNKYWSEKSIHQKTITIIAKNTEISNISLSGVDASFFDIPENIIEDNIERNVNPIVFEVGHNGNLDTESGSKTADLIITYGEGANTVTVPLSAVTYKPEEPDVFELPREVDLSTGTYTDTPDFTTLHDDYILPGEGTDGNAPDAVYKFTLTEPKEVNVEVLGDKGIYAIYIADSLKAYDGPGPSSSNNFVPGASSDVDFFCDFEKGFEGLELKNGDGDNDEGRNWEIAVNEGLETELGPSNCAQSLSYYDYYDYSIGWTVEVPLSPENYLVTDKPYGITENSVLSFYARSETTGWADGYKVMVSEDGINFETVFTKDTVMTTKFKLQEIPLGAYAGQTLYIAINHYTDEMGYLCIDDVMLSRGGSGSGSGSSNIYPAGTYYVVAAAESEFTVRITVKMDMIPTFTGVGNWNEQARWNVDYIPNSADIDVIIDGTATITENVKIRSVEIKEDRSLTVGANKELTVVGLIETDNPNKLVLEDGAQLFQTNDEVLGKFRMKIVAPVASGDYSSTDEMNPTGWQFISSPMKNAATAGFETAGIGYDLFKYDGDVATPEDLEWINYKGHDDFEAKFQPGRGYMASYTVNGIAEFVGEFNNATSFTFDGLKYHGNDPKAQIDNFHLLGNPFTFNMNMEWYNNNIAASGLAEGYAVVTTNGGYTYATTGEIKVGDGFFVKVVGDAPSLTYTANTRGRNKDNNYINLIASGKAGLDNVIINFADNRDGFDKLENFNKNIAEIYVKENESRYGILNYSEDVEEINIYFNAKQMGYYTINALTNADFANVTLVDRLTGVETDILTDSYTFQAMADDAPDRFILRMNRQVESENFVYRSGEELIINAEGSVQIIDVMGRIVYSNEIVNDNHRVNIGSLNSAAYIVRVVNANEVKTQKVVIW